MSYAALALATTCGTTQAGYVLSPLSNGSATASIHPGDSFELDLVLSTDAGDVHDSAILRVVFSTPGLSYLGYEWSAPYDVMYDDSDPLLGDESYFDPPLVLDEQTLSGVGYPDDVVDVELSNLILIDSFGEGTLATLTLGVPQSFEPGQTIEISVEPDTFADGLRPVATTAGEPFALAVVPEPATATLLLAVLAAVACQRLRVRRY